MLNLPVIKHKQIKVDLRNEVVDDLNRFVVFAQAQGEAHASVDNVVTYVIDKYFRSSSSDLAAFRKWLSLAPEREAAVMASRKADAMQRAKSMLSRRTATDENNTVEAKQCPTDETLGDYTPVV